ncbi:MAG: apolipoprotein N-acyltransferase [Bacteroidia bacterium]|nr:apolipoprotein N-acyltransferase [Bacteroidia bacterium]MDW8347949.1 apolipoprotein N-acyltransferase [Bacteroidia bacterium]
MSIRNWLKNPLLSAYLTGILGVLAFPPSPLFILAFILFVPLLYALLHHDFSCSSIQKPHFIKYASGYLWLSILTGLILGGILESQGVENTLAWIVGVLPAIILTSYTAQYHRFSAIYLALLLWNTGTCYWLCYASVAGGLGAILVNPLLQSLPILLFLRIYSKTTNRIAYAVLIAAWISFEYLHFRWDLSWSWITLGHTLSTFTFGMQFYEWTGALGGSLWIWIVNILILSIFLHHNNRLRKFLSVAIALPLLADFIFWFHVPQPTQNLTVSIVQPNIDPYHKFDENTVQKQLQTFISLIRQAQKDKPDWIILPETAIPYSIWEERLYQDTFIKMLQAELIHEKQAILLGITSVRRYINGQNKTVSAARLEGTSDWYDMYNAATIITKNGEVQFHRKSKLVPLVERMPFLSVLGFLEKYTMIHLGGGSNSLGKADKVQTLHHQKMRVAPIVCYESVYGNYVADFSKQGADFFAIITNDGWWRNTSGYIQHAYYAKMRAIENRKYIARCANTGRSMFIDARGGVHQPTQWWKEAVITQTIGIMNYTTLYTRIGDVLGWIGLLGLTFLMLKIRVRVKRNQYA